MRWFLRVVTCGAVGLAIADGGSAAAQVIEPNGVQVPGPTSGPAEESLQQYFESLMPPEPIDPVADASAEPGTFSPLCGFQAELVLSQSGAAAGLAWYNVPADPTSTPTPIFQLINSTTMTGAVISSTAIRSDPNYAGGLVGFALTKTFGGSTEQPIYYSEYMRNANCTACTMPGYWKMMLAYPSKLTANTYYLAFEDWEGANQSNWQGNDGDFNDKVFRLTGVRCPGGGDPCDTGQPGVCAKGLTECQTNAPLACKPIVSSSAEKCDGLDNDCNGMVDDGDLCGKNEVCDHGQCVAACNSGEFTCFNNYQCDEGFCVEPSCVGIRCEVGKVCRGGSCVAPCDGVVCPAGQECLVGRCVDPCAGVTCDGGRVCSGGVCVEKCDCSGCPTGLSCDIRSGQCVQPGCETQSCAAGMACVNGACVDPCDGAMCPGGAACVNGACQDPPSPTPDGGGGTTGTTSVVIITGSTGTATGAATGTASGTASSTSSGGLTATNGGSGASGTASGGSRGENSASGCSCRVARSRGSRELTGVLALSSLLFACWTRRSARRSARRGRSRRSRAAA